VFALQAIISENLLRIASKFRCFHGAKDLPSCFVRYMLEDARHFIAHLLEYNSVITLNTTTSVFIVLSSLNFDI